MEKIFDEVIITVSSQYQKKIIEEKIEERIEKKLFPENTKYSIVEEKEKLGSGGGLLKVIEKQKKNFDTQKILLINSAGNSKRMFLYADIGKVCIPTGRKLREGMESLVLDEIILNTQAIGKNMNPGILIVSGDCITTYDETEIGKITCNTAISTKIETEVGKRHGVFLEEKGILKKTLQKRPEEELKKIANKEGKVNLDTGMVYLNTKTIDKIAQIAKENSVQLNFYTDFMYPLASESTIQEYLEQPAEEETIGKELLQIRTEIWHQLKGMKMKVLSLETGKFIHYGTTKEFVEMQLKTNKEKKIIKNTKILGKVEVEEGCYIENSVIEDSQIGCDTIIIDSIVKNKKVPNDVLIKTFKIKKGYVTIIIGKNDEVKSKGEQITLFGKQILKNVKDDIKEKTLWNLKLFSIRKTKEEAFEEAIKLYRRVIY